MIQTNAMNYSKHGGGGTLSLPGARELKVN